MRIVFEVMIVVSMLGVPAASAGSQAETHYTLFCESCHGAQGDGKGPAARGLEPVPPDWTAGEVRLDANASGTPGETEDLFLLTRDGAEPYGGSALMAPWGGPLSDEEIDALVELIETEFFPPEPGDAESTGLSAWVVWMPLLGAVLWLRHRFRAHTD